jgi:adenylate cyclase
VEQALARTGPNALLLALAAEIEFARQDMGFSSRAEKLVRADALATQALELNPDLAEAHVIKGLVAWRRVDVPVTVRHVLRAAELDPGNAKAAWAAGFVSAEVGRTGEARKHGDRAYALDPLWWPAPFGSCLADLCEGDFDSALAKMVGMHTVGGDNPAADLWLGVLLLYAGRPDEAATPLDRAAAAGAGTFSATATFLAAMVRGDREAMRAVLADPGTREALEIDNEFSWQIAAAFASDGDTDEALYWLSRAIEMGFINHRLFAEVDPFLAKLRGNPRFEELMERAREKQQEVGA